MTATTYIHGDDALAAFLTRHGYKCSSDTVRRWRSLSDDPLPHERLFKLTRFEPDEVLGWVRRRVRVVKSGSAAK